MVLSSFDTPGVPFPLVSLILGCFIKILHQIWNNKRFSGKLTEWWRKECPAAQMTLRAAEALFGKSVFIWNIIPHVMLSQFFAHLSHSYSLQCAQHMRSSSLLKAAVKIIGVKHQKVGFHYSVKYEESAFPSFGSKGRGLKWKQFKRSE